MVNHATTLTACKLSPATISHVSLQLYNMKPMVWYTIGTIPVYRSTRGTYTVVLHGNHVHEDLTFYRAKDYVCYYAQF